MSEAINRKQEASKRWGSLKTERSTWWAQWIDLTMYMAPRNGRYFVQDRNRGWKRNANILDNTGQLAARTLSAGLMGGFTSPARPWFRLATADADLNKSHNVKIWLAQVTQMMLDIFQKSNTYNTLHSMYDELGVFGTACSIMQEDYQDVIRHYPTTIGEYCVATNFRGEVDTVYRYYQKTVGEVVRFFGINNVSNTVKQLYDKRAFDQWVTILHVIEPREQRDPSKLDSLNMAWKSVYWEIEGDSVTPLRESGYKKFPGLAPRWAVTGGDIYGHSPGMDVLGDVKQLNQEQLRKSQAIDYQVNPPLQVPTSLKNKDFDRLPGGITYYTPTGAGADKIQSMFDVRLDPQMLLMDIQDVRQRINSGMYKDLFLMMANQVDTRMTATEVAERHEEKLIMLGPVLERLHSELLSPLIENTFDMLVRANVLPPPPPEMQGMPLNVEMISMLAQAQRAIATNSIDRFLGVVGQMAQFKPDVLDKVDGDAIVEAYADLSGVDPQFIVAGDKVAIIRKQRAQQQQAAMNAQIADAQASAASKLGNTPTQGGSSTALDDATAQFQGYR